MGALSTDLSIIDESSAFYAKDWHASLIACDVETKRRENQIPRGYAESPV